MELIDFLDAEKKCFHAKLKLAQSRIDYTNELGATLQNWCTELGVLEFLKFETKNRAHDFGLEERDYYLTGFGFSIWIRHIKDLMKNCVMIGSKEVHFESGKWIYIDDGQKKDLTKSAFESILLNELKSADRYY